MKFSTPLLKGQFIRRYKRFFIDVLLDSGEEIVCHSPNTGSMRGLLVEGVDAWVTPHNDPKRKLQYTVEILGTSQGATVGVNTMRPNKIISEAITAGEIPELMDYANLKNEVKYGTEGKSRIDIFLSDDAKPDCYVEVKNVTLREDVDGVATAQFPDSVSTRGQKHLRELADVVADGKRGVMVFLCQRDDCTEFRPAAHIDPDYAAILAKVIKNGVEAFCYTCTVTPEGVTISKQIPINID